MLHKQSHNDPTIFQKSTKNLPNSITEPFQSDIGEKYRKVIETTPKNYLGPRRFGRTVGPNVRRKKHMSTHGQKKEIMCLDAKSSQYLANRTPEKYEHNIIKDYDKKKTRQIIKTILKDERPKSQKDMFSLRINTYYFCKHYKTRTQLPKNIPKT